MVISPMAQKTTLGLSISQLQERLRGLQCQKHAIYMRKQYHYQQSMLLNTLLSGAARNISCLCYFESFGSCQSFPMVLSGFGAVHQKSTWLDYETVKTSNDLKALHILDVTVLTRWVQTMNFLQIFIRFSLQIFIIKTKDLCIMYNLRIFYKIFEYKKIIPWVFFSTAVIKCNLMPLISELVAVP